MRQQYVNRCKEYLHSRDAFYCGVILVVYSLAWIFLLLNFDGVYWDDWVLYNQDTATVKNIFRMSGLPLAGDVHNFLLSFGNSVFSYRVVTFSSYLIVSLCVYHIAKKSEIVSPGVALLIALLVAVYPVNQARISMANATYAYSLALFFIAFVLVGFGSGRWRVVSRLTSLLLFFLSFFVMSLAMFYLVPFAYMAFMEKSRWLKQGIRSTSRSAVIWVFGKLDYLLLPFLFIALKSFFFASSELYASYNQISLYGLIKAVPNTWKALDNYFWVPLERALPEWGIYILSGFLVVSGLMFISSLVREKRLETKHFISNMPMLFSGIAIFYLGAYPYVAVGKYPSIEDWTSRHQLLFPFGGSLIIFSLVNILIKEKLQPAFFAILICCALLRDSRDMLDYFVDYTKQDAIIYQLGEIDQLEIVSNQIVHFDDQATELNTLGRVYRFYEFNGWLKQAFDRQDFFGMYPGDISIVEGRLHLAEHRQYNFHEFEFEKAKSPVKITIDVKTEAAKPEFQLQLSLMFNKLLQESSYEAFRNDFITLSYEWSDQ